LTDNHLPHVEGDEGCGLLLGRTVQDAVGGRVGSKDNTSEGVHEEVDPEELNGGEDRLHLGVCDGADKGEDDGSDGDGDLELEELLDAIVAVGLLVVPITKRFRG
jgi:hypothetical protein